MDRIISLSSALARDEQGASMVEYGLLLALIAVVAVGAVVGIGTGLDGQFQAISDCITTPGAASC